MPEPLPLPATPPAAAHLRNPMVFFDAASAYGVQRDWQSAAAQVAARVGGALERGLVPHLDATRSWNAAVVEGQLIAELPIARDRLAAVERMLAAYPASGRFGAVMVARKSNEQGPKMAWLDKQRATLSLADDLRGIATADALARAYGRQPLHVTLTAEQAQRYGLELPVGRVTARGLGPHAFELLTDGMPSGIEGLDQITNGAMTGLLASKQLTWAASTRYAPYRQRVTEILREANRQVQRQNFFVRGNLQDLLGRAKQVLESWNGRVFVGGGPRQHLLFGLGTDGAAQSERATLHLISGLLDNIQLAATFGFGGGVPSLRFARRKAVVDGRELHVLALEQARRWIPSDLHRLMDARGDLRIAFSFQPQAGAVLAAAGPQADRILSAWLSDIDPAQAKNTGKDDLLAVMVAAPLEGFAQVLQSGKLGALLALERQGAPTQAVVRRTGNGLLVKVDGPPARTTDPGARRRQAAARASGRAAAARKARAAAAKSNRSSP